MERKQFPAYTSGEQTVFTLSYRELLLAVRLFLKEECGERLPRGAERLLANAPGYPHPFPDGLEWGIQLWIHESAKEK